MNPITQTVAEAATIQGLSIDAGIAFIVGIAALLGAAKLIHSTIKSQADLHDLVKRELTGWKDPATGEEHPSLRSHVKQLSNRLETVEHQTRQLHPNGGSHLADLIRDTQKRVSALESDMRRTMPELDRRRITRTEGEM